MVFSVKNLTHLWREVRGVCECDSSSRRCLFSLSPILGASDCLLIQMVLAPSEPSNEGLFQVGIDLYIIGSNCPRWPHLTLSPEQSLDARVLHQGFDSIVRHDDELVRPSLGVGAARARASARVQLCRCAIFFSRDVEYKIRLIRGSAICRTTTKSR